MRSRLAPPAPASIASLSTQYSCINTYSSSERLKYYLISTAGPRAFLSSAVLAAIHQARNVPAAWGQGAEGYGLRYGSSFGKRAISNTLQWGVEAMLGEDSRFLPSGRSGAGPPN